MNKILLHDQGTAMLFLALLIPLRAEHYVLTMKQGSASGLSPEHIGVGEYWVDCQMCTSVC